MTPTTLVSNAETTRLTEAEQKQAAQLERIWREPSGFIGWFKAVHHTTLACATWSRRSAFF